MSMFEPIPLPKGRNEIFKDVMDYFEQLQKRKAQQEQFGMQEARLKDQFSQQMALNQAQLGETTRYHNAQLSNTSDNLGGVAGDIEDLEKLKQKYGEESPQFQLAKRVFESQIEQRESLSESRKNPYRFAPAQMKNITAFNNQIQKDFPGAPPEILAQISEAYLSGKDEINGKKLPELSSMANSLLQPIFKGSSTVALQNQSANLNNTISELKSFDVNPLKKYTGAKGSAKFAYQTINPSARDKDWYEYDAFKNSAQIYAMDTLRKGFGTSVVPGYVYETLGKMSNPVDPIWGDPEQIDTRWNKTIELIDKAAKNVTKQARHGATVDLKEEKVSLPHSKRIVKVRDKQTGEVKEMTLEEANQLMGSK